MTNSNAFKSAFTSISISVLAVTLSAGVSPAANIDLTKLPAPSTRKDVSFQKDIQPLFKASCIQCHSGERPRGGLRLDTAEHALKGGKDGIVITPGDSEKSKLVIAISQLDPHSAMPPKPRRPMGGPGMGANSSTNASGSVEGHSEHGMANASTNGPAGGPRGMMPPAKPLSAG